MRHRDKSLEHVLRESIEEQLSRYEKGRITRDEVEEELMFLAEHYQASLYISLAPLTGMLYCDRIRLSTEPTLHIDREPRHE